MSLTKNSILLCNAFTVKQTARSFSALSSTGQYIPLSFNMFDIRTECNDIRQPVVLKGDWSHSWSYPRPCFMTSYFPLLDQGMIFIGTCYHLIDCFWARWPAQVNLFHFYCSPDKNCVQVKLPTASSLQHSNTGAFILDWLWLIYWEISNFHVWNCDLFCLCFEM